MTSRRDDDSPVVRQWILFTVSAGAAALILATVFRPGHLLYRDAVSTPRSFVTDPALGLGDVAPRAVPQDWVIAVASRFVDGGWLVAAILFISLTLLGVGFGRLAAALVPKAGTSGAITAAVVAVWNPYVAERLLQGHWSLLTSCAALGWIAYSARRLRDEPVAWRWAALISAVCVAGFTPTGSVLAAAIMAATLLPPWLRTREWRRLVLGCGVWILGALPWLTATLVGHAPATSGESGFAVFGLRAEPGLGTLGTALGLGGIWNADAVPASRTIWWAAVATIALLAVVAAGAWWLWRRRRELDPMVGALAVLAAATAVAVSVAAIGPVADGLSALAQTVPGVGLFRDTQKYLALELPFFAIAAAAAVTWLRLWVPAGFALAAAALLVVAPLPDLAWGVGGTIRPVEYPADWTAVAQIIPADRGDVAVWPAGTVRRYPFTDTVSLNPLPRMIRATVTDSGRLTVDGVEVDPPAGRGALVDDALTTGGRVDDLARLGVGWVVVENGSPPAQLRREAQIAYRGEYLTLYRIPGAVADLGASAPARATVIAAHSIWLAAMIGGLVLTLLGTRRRTPR
ncbi:hypothetical protein AAFP30_10540 [Gordonia sp. CPCC 205515]|uniref:hypothetical protein n=1 Tax=Gordonia sp. CPCC 205515 TaxID=3140791 RepID=UPI003AF3EE52